jgi:hypothetical protein
MNNEEYHNHPAISQSMLKKLAESPWLIHAERETTKSLSLGTCLDLALTEPEAYNKLVVKDTKTTTVAGCISIVWKQLIDKWIVNLNNYEIKIFGKLWRFEELAKKCQKQKIMFWNDPITGELCRGKPDYYHSMFMMDLKSTCAKTRDEFIKQIYSVELMDAFPIGISSQPLSWGEEGFHRVTVQFAYQKYRILYDGNYNLTEAALQIFGSNFQRFINTTTTNVLSPVGTFFARNI